MEIDLKWGHCLPSISYTPALLNLGEGGICYYKRATVVEFVIVIMQVSWVYHKIFFKNLLLGHGCLPLVRCCEYASARLWPIRVGGMRRRFPHVCLFICLSANYFVDPAMIP